MPTADTEARCGRHLFTTKNAKDTKLDSTEISTDQIESHLEQLRIPERKSGAKRFALS